MKDKITLSSIHNFIQTEYKSPQDSEVIRRHYTSNIAILPNEDRTFIAKISTSDIDREGEVVDAKGIDVEQFMQNPVVLWNHQHSSGDINNIGKVLATEVRGNALYAKMVLAETTKANEIWSLIKGGFLKACSIGFVRTKRLIKGTQEFANKCKELGVDASKVMSICTGAELIENSIVPIGCNSAALVTAVSSKTISLSDEMIKVLDLHIEQKNESEPIVEPIVEPIIEDVAPIEEVIQAVEPVAVETIIEIGGIKYRLSQVKEEVPEMIREAPKAIEDVKVEEPIVEPVVEAEPIVEAPKPLWNVIRTGKRMILPIDTKRANDMIQGKII